jgi:hypothetical protein
MAFVWLISSRYPQALASEPGKSANVEVPFARTGLTIASRAGKVSSVPPPATALITPAPNAETARKRYVRVASGMAATRFQGNRVLVGRLSPGQAECPPRPGYEPGRSARRRPTTEIARAATFAPGMPSNGTSVARYLMLVLACLALPAQDLGAGAENTAVIAGTVVDSLTGVGIRKAEVRLNRLNGRPPADIYLTDNAGRFEAAGLNPGIYQLRVSRNGFVVPKWTKIVDTAQPEAREVVLKLTPQGVITGRVTDADGDPLDGVTIQLLRRQNYAGQTNYDAIRHEATDDLGEYRLIGLTTGRYLVAAERAVELSLRRSSTEGATAFARTFYPAATSPENAIWLDVKPGVELRQIDVRMERLPVVQVKGRITNADQMQREKLSLSLIPAAGEMAMLPAHHRVHGFANRRYRVSQRVSRRIRFSRLHGARIDGSAANRSWARRCGEPVSHSFAAFPDSRKGGGGRSVPISLSRAGCAVESPDRA